MTDGGASVDYYAELARVQAAIPPGLEPWRVPCADRMAHMLDLADQMPRGEWLRLVGNFWNTCPNSPHTTALRALLGGCDRRELDLLMDEFEISKHRELPERIQVYRGCYTATSEGLSWPLSRKVAEKFPSYVQHHVPGGTAILRSGWVNRNEVALKLSNFEEEVIAWNVFDTSDRPLGYDPAQVIQQSFEAYDRKKLRTAA